MALFHRSAAEYLDGVGKFVTDGLTAGEVVLVAVPGERIDMLNDALGTAGASVHFADMSLLGANPARIIPAIRAFLDARPGERVRLVGELVWPGRTPAQVAESLRHEAVLNLALAGTPTSALCPYDAAEPNSAVLPAARRVHPHVLTAAGSAPCPDYNTDGLLVGQQTRPDPHPDTEPLCLVHTFDDLPALRRAVTDRATAAGLPADRRDEFLVAVGEVATNGLAHTDHGAQVRCGLDRAEGSLVVEVATAGHINDPMIGRVLRPTATGGRGLWIVNQLCDLVELYSGPWGSLTRLHAHLTHAPSAASRAPA